MEKFAFTKVFQEKAAQLDIFKGAGVIPLVEGVLGESRDGLLATLGVTGSGKVGRSPNPQSHSTRLNNFVESHDLGIQVTAWSHTTFS